MRNQFRAPEATFTQRMSDGLIESAERLQREAEAQSLAPKTMTWKRAGMHALRLSVLGFIGAGLLQHFDLIELRLSGSNFPWLIVAFVALFGKSGADLDWPGRFRLLCAHATALAMLGLFGNAVLEVPLEETKGWFPLLLAINLAPWLLSDAVQKVRRK